MMKYGKKIKILIWLFFNLIQNIYYNNVVVVYNNCFLIWIDSCKIELSRFGIIIKTIFRVWVREFGQMEKWTVTMTNGPPDLVYHNNVWINNLICFWWSPKSSIVNHRLYYIHEIRLPLLLILSDSFFDIQSSTI